MLTKVELGDFHEPAPLVTHDKFAAARGSGPEQPFSISSCEVDPRANMNPSNLAMIRHLMPRAIQGFCFQRRH
jgi:hypothetical protein